MNFRKAVRNTISPCLFISLISYRTDMIISSASQSTDKCHMKKKFSTQVKNKLSGLSIGQELSIDLIRQSSCHPHSMTAAPDF